MVALADSGAEQIAVTIDIEQAEALVVRLQDLVNAARRARREAADALEAHNAVMCEARGRHEPDSAGGHCFACGTSLVTA